MSTEKTLSNHLYAIRAEISKEANEAHRLFMAKTAPGIQQVHGTPKPVLNHLAKNHSDGGIPLVEELWKSGVYEEQMLAVKLLERLARKHPADAIRLLKAFTPELTEWSICDTLAMGLSRALHKKEKKTLFALSDQWAASDRMWTRRMSLVLLWYFCRFEEDRAFIHAQVNRHVNDKEHYIRKAVTWIRRELKKQESE